MQVIHKSFAKEIVQNILLSVAFLNALLIIEKLLKLSKIFSSVGIDLFNLATIIILLQPQLLVFTIPMSLLLSILLAYGRAQADNEIVILMASGMPYKKVFKPVINVGVIVFLIAALMSIYFGPEGVRIVREKVLTILSDRAPLSIEEGVFNKGFKGITIFVKEKPDSLHMKEVIIFDERREDSKIIFANEGKIKKEKDTISLSLIDGRAYFHKGVSFNEIKFKEYIFKLTPNIDPIAKKTAELSVIELISKISSERKIDYKLELYKRISLPILCLISIFLSPSLCKLIGKSGRLGGVTLGLGVFAIYYILMIYGANLAKAGIISAEIGSFLPVGILGILSAILWNNIDR
ncbi:LptF/LptG family permease [Thermodesulfovibrio hydrogeniphilus]